MTRTPKPSLKQLSRKLGAVIDITRTIDRNSDDGLYSDQGDEIVYVFDTNVVQMFLEPYKNPQFSQVFYAPIWGEGRIQDKEINAQACLIAAEYLMSGALPGQIDGRWHMTKAHYREMQSQIDHLAIWGKEIANRIRTDEPFGNFALGRLSELNAALILEPSDGRETFLDLARRQGLPKDAIRQIGALPEEAFRERAIGIRSREVCRLLAQDWILEPADQIVRLRTTPIASRFRDLEGLLKPTDDDWEEIRAESQDWRRVISLVQERDGKLKTGSALTADCDALALVSWANRQKTSRTRRIVFVTGDRTLLDACRHRYVQDPQQGFFFIRPITHFVPTFNPRSAESKVATQEAFERLRKVLEGAMVPLNLGLLAGEDPERRMRSRDAFALQVERSVEAVVEILTSFFPKSRDAAWVSSQEKALDKLVAELRVIELLMLEAFPHLIAERLNKERQRFLREAENAGSVALADAIDKRFESAKGAGIQFSVQMMADAVEESLKRVDFSTAGSQRAPIQIRISFSDEPNKHLDYLQAVEWLKQQNPAQLQETLERLSKRPARMFALAALLALSLEVWKDTDRYAELAAAAADEDLVQGSVSAESDPNDYFEYRFLRAVSLRFRLASFRPQIGSGYVDTWAEWVSMAKEILDECIAHHQAAEETSRQLRGLSERAALQIAYCEWFAFGALADLKPDDVAAEDAVSSFRQAVDDLIACDSLEGLAVSRVNALAASAKSVSTLILQAATRQFRTNILAAEAAGNRLAQMWPSRGNEVMKLVAKLPTRRDFDWPNMPPIAQAYLFASKKQWAELAAMATDKLSLALDLDVIRGLQAMGRPPEHAGSLASS